MTADAVAMKFGIEKKAVIRGRGRGLTETT
jgi:hypothetical protein